MTPKRAITSFFLFASILFLVIGAHLPWWVGELDGGSFEIDLRGMKMCLNSVCGYQFMATADGSVIGWARLGVSTFASSLVAAALVGVCLWLTITQRKRSTFHWLAGVMAMFTGLLALLVVLLQPDFGVWTPSYGMACTFAGALVGAAAISVAARAAPVSG